MIEYSKVKDHYLNVVQNIENLLTFKKKTKKKDRKKENLGGKNHLKKDTI